jgi:PAS domain S-box-containing protein
MPQRLDGILIVDANARTLYASKGMAEILGVSRADMIGRRFFRYVFLEDFASLRLFDSQNYADTNLFTFRLYREDGSAIWVEMQGSPLVDASERVIGTIGIFRVAKPVDSRDETLHELMQTGAW